MNMKSLTLSVLFAGCTLALNAQTDLNLNLHHKFDGADFQYGTTYTLEGRAVSLSRVQYYLSGFEITHDGGQTTAMPDTYVLGSGNITSYSLGQENVTSLEGISFDLGVDSARNHMGTSFWTQGHPLGPKSPSMDWNWPDGYFFWTISGKVDDNNDGTPNKNFEMHGIGDHLLRDVNGFSGLTVTGASIDLDIYVNVADWLRNLTLASVGFSHDGGANNIQVGDNTNDETVFTLDNPLSVDDVEIEASNIYADYTVAYAPTIYYDLATQNQVDIKIFDMGGKVVLESDKMNPEGNYFVRKELPDGSYLITFSNSELDERFRFVVKN